MLRWMLGVFLAAGAMAMASSLAGTWEGKVNGTRAVALSLSESNGKVDGRALFYIVRSKSDEQPVDGLPAALPLSDIQWDGKLLRFSVVNSESETVRFEMKLTGDDSASLTRLGSEPMTVPLERQASPAKLGE